MGKLVSITQAIDLRRRLHQQEKMVVFTNGVFDLLHVGHVRYLQAARTLGQVLFVGLNSDLSTQKLKGPGRPLVPQAERAEILCALACVDYVMVFDEPTAERVVEILQPDVYTKGGDYADEARSLPEAPIVQGYGGRVVLLPYTSGHSTTRIVERVLKARCFPEDRAIGAV
jgi:D-beta-D-heptose 7-phosphate kinase/D-beta-D-heptose 1-phosphate adenosyltransferase